MIPFTYETAGGVIVFRLYNRLIGNIMMVIIFIPQELPGIIII